MMHTNSAQFVQHVIIAYTGECSRLGPNSPDRFLTLVNLPAGIDRQLAV